MRVLLYHGEKKISKEKYWILFNNIWLQINLETFCIILIHFNFGCWIKTAMNRQSVAYQFGYNKETLIMFTPLCLKSFLPLEDICDLLWNLF